MSLPHCGMEITRAALFFHVFGGAKNGSVWFSWRRGSRADKTAHGASSIRPDADKCRQPMGDASPDFSQIGLAKSRSFWHKHICDNMFRPKKERLLL